MHKSVCIVYIKLSVANYYYYYSYYFYNNYYIYLLLFYDNYYFLLYIKIVKYENKYIYK